MKRTVHAGSNHAHDPYTGFELVYQGMLQFTVCDCDECIARYGSMGHAGCSHGQASSGQASQDAHRKLQLPSQTGE